MSTSHLCTNCNNNSLFRDDDIGGLFCSLCGVAQPFDQYKSFTSDIDSPQGTFFHIRTSVSCNFYFTYGGNC
ncbi:unnamed protein product [Lathyrus oleraceus]